MLRANAFAADKPFAQNGAQVIMGSSKGFTVDNSEDIDKYINDYRLLDIRCGVLEDERLDYQG